MNKPYSQSCENNKFPILQVIETIFTDNLTIWEIGSGTGQHACFFAENLPHVKWQCTDRLVNLAGIDRWLKDANLSNLLSCLELDVSQINWPCQQINGIFTANTLHIMSVKQVEDFFSGLERYLASGAQVCIYGPFNYHGQFTSESNHQFDLWLKSRDLASGIRDFEYIEKQANRIGLALQHDFEMPANNRLLYFKKS